MWHFICGFGCGYCIPLIMEKSDKIKQIHSTIQEHSPGFLSSWYKTIETIAKIKYENLYNEYIRKIKTPVYVTHELYEVEYFHRGKKYRILLKDTTKEKVSINVYDGQQNDITDKFLEYFGPQYDFHNTKFTPSHIGYDKIIIIDSELNEKVYYANDQFNDLSLSSTA